MILELAVIVALIVTNGLLAMSEIAVVSSRRGRLQALADRQVAGAATALRLIDDPGRFLSTVQIGITLVGIAAGAFGGATLAARLAPWLDGFDAIRPHGATLALMVVVAGVTYLSLVVGELVPKRIALATPERIAAIAARPMHALSRIAAPAVWVLRVSTEAVLRLAGIVGSPPVTVTEDEVRSLIAEGARTGVFEPKEREMIEGVLRLADRSVRALMTPRGRIVWIDRDAGREATVRLFRTHRLSRVLVCEGGVDAAVGVLHAKDVVPAALGNGAFDIGALMLPPIVVSDRSPVLRLMDRFRRGGVHLAVVVDEYGTTEGVVTPTDVLESIAGALPERGEPDEERIVRREDGSWLVDGLTPLDEFEDVTGLRGLRGQGDFHTLAGYVLHRLGRLPRAGEAFADDGVRYEVVDMDGRRIDRILVSSAGR